MNNLDKFLKNLCKINKYKHFNELINLQINLKYIIGDISKYIIPVQIRSNKMEKNILVCHIYPLMMFEIESAKLNIINAINIYFAKELIINIIFLPKNNFTIC